MGYANFVGRSSRHCGEAIYIVPYLTNKVKEYGLINLTNGGIWPHTRRHFKLEPLRETREP